MTEEQIVKEIAENYYDHDGFVRGNNVWLVSPDKLAAFLEKMYRTPLCGFGMETAGSQWYCSFLLGHSGEHFNEELTK